MDKPILIMILAWTLLLTACFSPWAGDEAVLTVSVGGGGRALIDLTSSE